MKILQLAHSYLPERTGISEVARCLSEGLVARGHEVHVATSHVSQRSASTINGVHVWPFRIAGNWLQGYAASSEEISRFRSFVAEGSWDVQANHCGQVWTTDLLLDLLPTLPWVKVYTPHGLPAENVPEWEPYYRQMPAVFRQFDAVTCLSQSFEEKPFCDRHGIPARVIPNGTNPKDFSGPGDLRRRWGIGDRPFVLNVSNHSPQKCHQRLFELAGLLGDECTVLNIGNGYPAAKWQLGRLGVRGGCYYECNLRSCFGRKVEFRFNVPRPQIAAALCAADVFVLPSRWEASPLVILEAMAAGLPWVSFDVGNVRDHAGGIVVGSIEEMASETRKLLSDRDLRARLGREGRERVLERHTWDKVVESYERLYLELHGRKRIGELHQ
jgi:glycosyltransferase involved in cell wall biosynthesis